MSSDMAAIPRMIYGTAWKKVDCLSLSDESIAIVQTQSADIIATVYAHHCNHDLEGANHSFSNGSSESRL